MTAPIILVKTRMLSALGLENPSDCIHYLRWCMTAPTKFVIINRVTPSLFAVPDFTTHRSIVLTLFYVRKTVTRWRVVTVMACQRLGAGGCTDQHEHIVLYERGWGASKVTTYAMEDWLKADRHQDRVC